MSWELFYTSAPRGLKLGSRGFCTVARTEGMPVAMIDRLESLSSYPAEPGGAQPVLLAHWRVPTGGRTRSVLSRVAPAGSDYSGRLNKLAYHLVLEPGEQTGQGPVWLLSQAQVMKNAWDGEPRLLPPTRLNLPAEADADRAVESPLARKLADAFLLDPTKSACVIYPAGRNPLQLLGEAMSLLEPRMRWQVTFSTLFGELAAGLSCNWRCVMAGTLAAAEAGRHATSGVVIDLGAA